MIIFTVGIAVDFWLSTAIMILTSATHLNSATLPILGQNRSKNQQLEAPSELVSPFNFRPLDSSIAWAPKPQNCCPDIGASSSETDLPPPNSGLFLPLKRPIDRPHQA